MWNNFRRCLYQTLLILLIYQLIRIAFYSINQSHFKGIQGPDLPSILFHSLRFDLSAALTWLIPLFIIGLLPFSHPLIKRLLWIYYLFVATISFLFEISDIGYYPYVRKRMTMDVFHILTQKADFLNLLPSYLVKFWYVPILILFLLILFYYSAHRILQRIPVTNEKYGWKEWIFYPLILTLVILGIRGTLSLKPITPNTALIFTSSENSALLYTTTFSLLHSLEDQKLNPVNFVDNKTAQHYYSVRRDYFRKVSTPKENVVIIILESFGKMYTGIGGRTSYTPFLDHLCSQGLICTHAFANASSSATGIPAILAGIPNFYNEAFTTSPYGRNKMDALGTLLKSIGYKTSFFHGGTNGTMNFNIFAAAAGFDRYIGRSEYPNSKDYDGTWGISDLPFLQFYAEELKKEKEPFLSTVFTLSSHEPFTMPPLPLPFLDSLNGIQKGIRYTDYALQCFFEKASKESWFQHTLFVITADHNYMAGHDPQHYYDQGMGLFSIPILFYHPNPTAPLVLNGHYSEITQQIDILPSILDYLNFPRPFFAFGNSIFREGNHFAYNNLNGNNLYVSRDTALVGSDHMITDMFDLKKDSQLNIHIPVHACQIDMEYKSFLQTLHRCIVADSMTLNP